MLHKIFYRIRERLERLEREKNRDRKLREERDRREQERRKKKEEERKLQQQRKEREESKKSCVWNILRVSPLMCLITLSLQKPVFTMNI
jgi:septal ring factor EnvC (AmiA/AmiB activator)